MIEFEGIVRFQVEGFHFWPSAPLGRSYLATRHRHLFHVEVSVELAHSEREIEFHDLLDFCKSAFPGGELGAASCEQMASELLRKVSGFVGGDRLISVSVFEDGEVGARVTG